MAEKNIENVLMSKEELLKMRTSMIHSLADKKVHLERSYIYLESGNLKNFCDTYRKSFLVHTAGYLFLASLLGIMVTLGYVDPGINTALSYFIGFATSAIVILAAMVVACMSEVRTRTSIERSSIELYEAQIDTESSWLATIDNIIGIANNDSEKEVDRFIKEKIASGDL